MDPQRVEKVALGLQKAVDAEGNIDCRTCVRVLQRLGCSTADAEKAAISCGVIPVARLLSWLFSGHAESGIDGKQFDEAEDKVATRTASSHTDPRWDTDTFNKWCEEAAVTWVKVGYLRTLLQDGGIICRQQDLPVGTFHVGPPPDCVQLYACSASWLGRYFTKSTSLDPEGFHLQRIVQVLDEDSAYDDDLVFMNYTARPQLNMNKKYLGELSRGHADGHYDIHCENGDTFSIPLSWIRNHWGMIRPVAARRVAEACMLYPEECCSSWMQVFSCGIVALVVQFVNLKPFLRLEMAAKAIQSSLESFVPNFQAPKVLTADEYDKVCRFEERSYFMVTHFRLKAILCAEVPSTFGLTPYFQRGWTCGFDFHLSSFTQRIVNSRTPLVKAHLKPEFLAEIQSKLIDGTLYFETEGHRARALRMKTWLWSAMPEAREDAVGFQTICREAGFHWIKVSFVRFLADRGGPAPRCQDLPAGTYIVGEVPQGCQPFVLSYSWSSHLHFAPGGGKMKQLREALDALHADDDDVCFVDYMSLWQDGGQIPEVYAKCNNVKVRPVRGMVTLPNRTDAQNMQFRFALFETTRLYAFAGGRLANGVKVLGCKVIVLPRREDAYTFPDHGEISEQMNSFCSPPAVQIHSNWGFQRLEPYEEGGWTCAEYAVARRNGTIANFGHPDVQSLQMSRQWPETVQEYAEMMDENAAKPISFTKKGDRDVVLFNFYKYSHHIGDKL